MQKREQLTVNGLVREFLIYVPEPTSIKAALPVIISLHGTLGSAEQMMEFADFRPIADRDDVVIVCPEGITQTWNDGRDTKAHKEGVDDIGFINELITYLIKAYAVDAGRIYVTGMSNGGFMASRLACELPRRIAAIAVVAATMDKVSGMKPKDPMPVMYMHGTKDRMVPYAGGPTKAAGGNVYGHVEMIQLWVSINQCDTTPTTTTFPDRADDGTSVIKSEFSNGLIGVKVVSYTIVNGGHTWPGGPQYAPKNFVGLVTHNLNACEEIWSFFKPYTLQK